MKKSYRAITSLSVGIKIKKSSIDCTESVESNEKTLFAINKLLNTFKAQSRMLSFDVTHLSVSSLDKYRLPLHRNATRNSLTLRCKSKMASFFSAAIKGHFRNLAFSPEPTRAREQDVKVFRSGYAKQTRQQSRDERQPVSPRRQEVERN